MIKLDQLKDLAEKWLPDSYYNKRYGYVDVLYKADYIAIVEAKHAKSDFITDRKSDTIWLINYYNIDSPKLYLVNKMNFQKYISQVMFTGEVELRGKITDQEREVFKEHGIFVLNNEV